MKLSDAKFLREPQVEAEVVQPLTVHDRHMIRSAVAQQYTQTGVATPEYVSFFDPTNNIRRHGWLVGYERDGQARIEISDGAYTVVPSEVVESPVRASKAAKTESIRDAIGQKSARSMRADFLESRDLAQVSSNDYSLMLQYSSSSGSPSDEDVRTFVASRYPGFRILDAAILKEGRLEVFLTREGEMGPAVAGEVEEVLDPSDVLDKKAIGPSLHKQRTIAEIVEAFNNNMHDHRAQQLATEMITNYMKGGGAMAALRGGGSFDARTLLAQAIKSTAGTNKALWHKVSNFIVTMPNGIDMTKPSAPGEGSMNGNVPVPGQEQKPGQKPEMSQEDMDKTVSDSVSDPQDVDKAVNDAVSSDQSKQPFSAPGKKSPPTPPGGQKPKAPGAPINPVADKDSEAKPEAKPKAKPEAKPFEQEKEGDKHDSKDNLRSLDEKSKAPSSSGPIQSKSSPDPQSKPESPVTKQADRSQGEESEEHGDRQPPIMHDRPSSGSFPRPSMKEVFANMRCDKVIADGDYLIFRIVWDPSIFKGVAGAGVKQTIISFVKGVISQNDRHRDMGWTGRPKFVSCDLQAGLASLEVRSSEARAFARTVVDGDEEFNNYGF